MSKKSEVDYQWIKSIRRFWIMGAEFVSIFIMFLGILIAVLLSLFDKGVWGSIVFGISVVLSFSSGMIQYFLFYHAIRCPACGHNPNRYKNGKNIPTKTAWKRLSGMKCCPECKNEGN